MLDYAKRSYVPNKAMPKHNDYMTTVTCRLFIGIKHVKIWCLINFHYDFNSSDRASMTSLSSILMK